MQVTIEIGCASLDHVLGVLRVGGVEAKIVDAAALVAAGSPPAAEQQRVTIEFDGYNAKRMGKPWIARVVAWPVGDRPEIEFGRCVGAYDVEVLAAPGDVVRFGQKDNRNPRGTISKFGIVSDDLTVNSVSEADAREHWLGTHVA